MFRIANNIIIVLKNSMNDWKSYLYSDNEYLCNVVIKRVIFQGDSVSSLWCVITLISICMVLTKVRMSYPLGKNEPVVNHLLFMYDFKQFAKSERLIPEGRQCKNGWNVVLDFQVCCWLWREEGSHFVMVLNNHLKKPWWSQMKVEIITLVFSKLMTYYITWWRTKLGIHIWWVSVESKLHSHKQIVTINTWVVQLDTVLQFGHRWKLLNLIGRDL